MNEEKEAHPIQDRDRPSPVWISQEIDLKEPEDKKPVKEPRSGDLCPECRSAQLDYDGLLNLSCPKCGYAVGGCFT